MNRGSFWVILKPEVSAQNLVASESVVDSRNSKLVSAWDRFLLNESFALNFQENKTAAENNLLNTLLLQYCFGILLFEDSGWIQIFSVLCMILI